MRIWGNPDEGPRGRGSYPLAPRSGERVRERGRVGVSVSVSVFEFVFEGGSRERERVRVAGGD